MKIGTFSELDPAMLPRDPSGKVIGPGCRVRNGTIGGFLMPRDRYRMHHYAWWYVHPGDMAVSSPVATQWHGWDDDTPDFEVLESGISVPEVSDLLLADMAERFAKETNQEPFILYRPVPFIPKKRRALDFLDKP